MSVSTATADLVTFSTPPLSHRSCLSCVLALFLPRPSAHGRQANLYSVKQPSSIAADGSGDGGNSPARWKPDSPLEGLVITGQGGSKRGKKTKEVVAPEPGSGAELGVARPPSDFYTKRFRPTRG